METSRGLFTGTSDGNELVVIEGHEEPKAVRNIDGQLCEICGDTVGLTVDGDLFVACEECGFPVCRPCYEYERREGTQVCPQCQTRYKRIKGSPRVEGDEDEDDVDDIEQEFRMLPGKISNGDDDENAKSPSLDPSKVNEELPISSYGLGESGSARWNEKDKDWRLNQGNLCPETDATVDPEKAMRDEARQPLSRKVAIPSGRLSPYRMMVVARLIITVLFILYRISHPVPEAIGLWLISVSCEIWLSLSWMLDVLPKWFPTDRETYLDRLSLRYEPEDKPNLLSPLDVFVTAVDPIKEPPLLTANTVLSILAMDYPADRIACYVSDDGASLLTFEALQETAEFARKWVPFCKKHSIEPRAPEKYFSEKIDFLKDKVQPTYVKERRTMKREYEEFKVRINSLVARFTRVPVDGWTMKDGTPWPGNNTRDHPGMIQVLLAQSGGPESDAAGNEIPRLVYVSREKRPGFPHHSRAGALNALLRVSAVLSNAPFVLNLDCNHYVNNSKAVRDAMCFFMDQQTGKSICFVQFPIRFDSLDAHDRYANRNTVLFDIKLRCEDGIQGPTYVGSACILRRKALYGCDPPKVSKRPKMVGCDCCPCFGARKRPQVHSKHDGNGDDANITGKDEDKQELMSHVNFENKFGKSAIFVNSTLDEEGGIPSSSNLAALLKEAIHVMSSSYEERTPWGKEVVLTGSRFF